MSRGRMVLMVAVLALPGGILAVAVWFAALAIARKLNTWRRPLPARRAA